VLPAESQGPVPADQECRFLLNSPPGVSAVVSSHGAALVALVAPDRRGRFSDVVLGYDCRADYVANADMYLGCTVGRVAQRIKQARFTLDGVEYELAQNNGRNHLHGGAARSFDKVNWQASPRTMPDGQEVEFRHVSPHLEEGYPGRVDATITYRLTAEGELQIDYSAITDRRTPVSLINHAYWNLAGAGSPTILDHELTLWADRYTPTDGELIPTGEVLDVNATPLDFRSPTVIGERIDSLERTGGYDHNLVLSTERPSGGLAARLRHPASGRVLEIRTGQPCIQVYSGNLMRPTTGKMGAYYDRRSGLCLETQAYPDAVHHPAFESVILEPGRTYRETAGYRFLVDRGGPAD
jgi:aldose 1-epimerase